MWSHSSSLWTISVFYSLNICLHWVVTCLLSFYSQCCFCNATHSKNPLKSTISKLPYQEIRLDNAGEFSFQTFIDFYMSIGIDIQHPNVHVHNQNGLACLTITFKNITTSLYLGWCYTPCCNLNLPSTFYLLWIFTFTISIWSVTKCFSLKNF